MTKHNAQTSSAGGSPAKTSAAPESERVSTGTAPVSGPSSLGAFAYFDPGSCSLKTSQRSLFGGLTECSPILPNAGSMRSGQLYERPTLERPISGAESSSSRHDAAYPTPMARDHKGPNQPGRQGGPGLPDLATTWPTPMKADASRASGTFARGNPTLSGAVHDWPTPTTSHWSRRHGYMREGHSGTTLMDAMREHAGLLAPRMPMGGESGGLGMVLCPEFVEALMGIPAGWSRVCDELDSEPSETP
jgi:hypothetical protein